jgi:hypothetical protein
MANNGGWKHWKQGAFGAYKVMLTNLNHYSVEQSNLFDTINSLINPKKSTSNSTSKTDYGKPVIDLLSDFAITLDENTEYEVKLIRDEFSKYVLEKTGVEIKNNTRNAHIALATVNEKSRIHHNIKRKDFDRKNLFFYPDIESKKVLKSFNKEVNGKVVVYFKGSEGSLESINADEIA